MSQRPPFSMLVPLVTILLTVAAAGDHPGYVDGSAFIALADEDRELVQVSLSGPLLELLSGAIRDEEPELSEMVSGLASVSAVVVSVPGRSAERAAAELQRLRTRLEKAGWRAVARVREESSEVTVMALTRGETVEGVTMTVFDRNEGRIVFTNIAGTIDMALLGSLSRRLSLPGLEQLPRGEAEERRPKE